MDLDGVVRFLRDSPDHRPVVLVSITTFGKYSRGALEVHVFCSTKFGPANICFDQKLANGVCLSAEGDVRENFVERLEFSSSAFITDDSSILSKYPKAEVSNHWDNDKGGLRRARRQLFEIT